MKKLILILILTLIYSFIIINAQTKANFTSLDINTKEEMKDLEYSVDDKGTWQFLTTGNDPYFFTQPMKKQLPEDQTVLSFEYFSPKGLDHLQIFFLPSDDMNHSKMIRRIGTAEGWVEFSVDLGPDFGDWGKEGDYLRLDLGRRKDINIQIRNLRFREMTEREKEIEAQREEKMRLEAIMENNLKTYLASDFKSSINEVSVKGSEIIIKGNAHTTNELFLCEVPPYLDVTEANEFVTEVRISENDFEIELPRFEIIDDIQYDRLLSKWVLATKTDSGYSLRSHAKYASSVNAKFNLPDEKPTSKKGLGGFSTGRGHVEDLEELDITSATVNIWFTRFMHTKPAPDRIEHVYNGKSWYFEKDDVERFDETFTATAEKNIITAAILLVSKAEQCPDPEIGRMMQHPDMDPAGIYSMPNMTNPESVECYAAALDFLASRYSREDKKYGRINHWIMHNEVDAGWVWTNMGEKTELIFMDAYIKSMRMCYNIARSYNPHSEVFVSLTHYWAWTSNPHFYPSKNLMEILLDYTKAEGDFEWALAQHPYPESLFEPKTWLDQKVKFSFDSPLITFKNIEVLNAWIKKPEVLYQGKYKRTLWLSENGTNSKTYSEQDLKEQAAGFAYTWKKMMTLDGIDGFQWHNWFDNRNEGGLRLGLRRFPDDEEDPGGKKPVWFVYEAAGRDYEDEVFDPYKELIGIEDWEQVIYFGPIDQDKKRASFRDVQADTWVATDELGRELPLFAECGPEKGDRFVGIFYFMTHTDSTGNGPFDVTKIVAENPENPQWGKGSHFWGEPEIGYYLNTEKWVAKKHAYQLSDAGVDVIIFDVTNNRIYPEVYTTICETWREMRAEGEKTPDITFLGSEISVNKLWEEFYEKGMYPDLWFRWKGKPLLLYGQHEQPQRNKVNDIEFSEDIMNFFSLRQSWAWTSLPWYDNGKDEWPWVDHFPQTIGWHESPDKAENVPVAVGQHPLSNIGRSFHQFHQPENDKYDLTPFTDMGLFFEEQWGRALEVDPEFVFVTGWNEWSAGRQVMGEDITKNLLKWDFYPGAHLGKVGEPLKTGDSYFIDQYNQEYSRDIEPMKGGHTDNYYYQLIANVRKYKGVQKGPEAGEPRTIDISGSFDQWKEIKTTYYDHIGDTEHRSSPGVGQAGPYIDKSGRNDIIESKVAHDKDNFYIYVKTKNKLTPHTDPAWMLLYIDADQDKSTGWEGYDFLINADVISESTTVMQAFEKRKWKDKAELKYNYKENELMIEIPRDLLKNDGFDFHWSDNIPMNGKISDFFMGGDNAPERRANYRFILSD